MPSLREIRRKIKQVKSTQKITRAMKMVAAARMRRAQTAILNSRPFAVKMEGTIRHLAELEVVADVQAGREVQIHPFFDVRSGNKAGLVLVTSDKGLCGAFNAGLLRSVIHWLKANKDKAVSVAVVGRKGRDFLRRVRGFDLQFLAEIAGIFPKVNFAHAELLGKAILEAYEKDNLSQVVVVYNEFKSVAVQRVVVRQMLPLEVPLTQAPHAQGFFFEPRREMLLEALLPRFLKAQLYRILLESQASELAARMNAMDSASKNAGELIGGLTLHLNRTRQAMITREIAELVGGAEALAS